MKRAQRRRHLALWLLLALVIGATVAAALIADARVGRALQAPPAGTGR